MYFHVLGFGIAKDIFNGSSVSVHMEKVKTVGELKTKLEHTYPKLKQLASYMIAVNNNYSTDLELIKESDEIAVIPPVTGG